MEYCWLYPWIVVIGGGFYGGTRPVLSPGWVFTLLLVAQLAVRPALEGGRALRHARGLLVGSGLILGLLAVHAQHYSGVPLWSPAWLGGLFRSAHDALPAVPTPVFAALVAALLWWRGLALGVRETDALAIDAAYKTGVGAIVVYFLAAAIYGDSAGFAAAGPTLPGSLPAFFFLGLSALALSRLAVIWDRSQPDERVHFPARAWVLLVTGLVGLILLAASMSAGLAAADVTTYLGLALRPLLPVVEVLFIILFFIAGLVVRVLIAVLSRIPRRTPQELETPPPTAFDDLLRRLREINMSPDVIEGARWTMVLAVVLLLALGMALTIVLMRRRERKADDDEHESVWSSQDALRGLRRLIPRIRLRRRDPDMSPVPAVRSMRRIYRELLALGAGLGAVRHPSTTPREHGPSLRDVLPDAAGDVASLTDAYERARYGAWKPAASEVRAAEEALQRIKRAAVPEATPES
jgi:hypothetical protein